MPSPTGPTHRARARQRLEVMGETVAVTFALHILELFPPWFDFAPERFAILGDRDRIRLFVANSDDLRSVDHLVISTSDARCMDCTVISRGMVVDHTMDMH
jgi:hypothetical protein